MCSYTLAACNGGIYVADIDCRFPLAGVCLGAGGESVLDRAGETLGEVRAFLVGFVDLVFWIFFGGLPSDEEDELEESLELKAH